MDFVDRSFPFPKTATPNRWVAKFENLLRRLRANRVPGFHT
jgi:hypothetical protein